MAEIQRGSARLRALVGYALVVAAALSWGTWPWIFSVVYGPGEPPIPRELGTLVIMATVTFAPLPLLVRDRVRAHRTARDWLFVVWLGVADAANVALFVGAYARTTVAIAVLTHSLAPLFVALVSPFLLGEAPRLRTFAAVLVALAGLLVVLSPWKEALRPGDVMGALFGAGSAVFYASNVVVSKRLAGKFSATELMVYHGLVALPCLALLVPRGAFAHVPLAPLAKLVLAGLGPGALAGLAFTWGLRRVPATHAATLALLEPVCAVVLGVLVLGQALAGTGVLGVGLVVGAAVVVLASPPDQGVPESRSTSPSSSQTPRQS